MPHAYYNLSVQETLDLLQSGKEGLNSEQVHLQLQKHGKNIIPKPKSKTLAGIFLHQFLNPLIYVLIAAAIISVVTGDVTDAIFIMAIILINAFLGTYQEWNAENSAQALQDMVKVMSRVKRNGKIVQLNAEELVPGDIILLESGNKIPADARLIEANDLLLEEALLTGESTAITKTTEPLKTEKDLSIGDRTNMVFAATTIQKGRGMAVVTATATHTEIGKIASSLASTSSEKPPLEKRMELFSKKISIVVLVVCTLLGVIGYLEGKPAHDIFFLMVAVGVSAIPEGLPVALTVALSIGTRRMAKRNVIVRKLPAVEGLGSCTLIASDKTGTLTMDQQSIQQLYVDNKIYTVTGQGYNGDGHIILNNEIVTEPDNALHKLILAAILANEGILRKTAEGWEHSGDAVDVAFRALAYKAGKEPKYFLQQAQVLELIPYESERKYSGVFYEQNGTMFFAMKGAVETVLENTTHQEKEHYTVVAEKMAKDGFRVMALAAATVKHKNLDNLPKLQVLGLVGMIDPLRPEAIEAVKECKQAGISVVMVTGDHPATALTIAQQLGIAEQDNEVITGTALTSLEQESKESFAEKIKHKKVFARVAPLQKQKIVEAFKQLGNFVAVTGDGANDAPALKSAHIGVAMGAGTDLAKEASSIIVTDNNFASIAAGVEEGRFTFDNLRKIIYLLLATGAAELLAIGLVIILNMPLPFIAVQLLWLNLVTNGIQDIALAFEKGDIDVMRRLPRKPDESIFDKLMISQIVVSGLYIALLVFGVWHYLLSINFNEVHARTIVVMLMVLMQNFHVLNCRSELKSFLKVPLKNNVVLIAGIIIAQTVHIAAAYIPGLNTTLQLEPITLQEWLTLVPLAFTIVIVMEVFKWYWRKKLLAKA
jgi:magnesium-transporting ATPase (P-type)